MSRNIYKPRTVNHQRLKRLVMKRSHLSTEADSSLGIWNTFGAECKWDEVAELQFIKVEGWCRRNHGADEALHQDRVTSASSDAIPLVRIFNRSASWLTTFVQNHWNHVWAYFATLISKSKDIRVAEVADIEITQHQYFIFFPKVDQLYNGM